MIFFLAVRAVTSVLLFLGLPKSGAVKHVTPWRRPELNLWLPHPSTSDPVYDDRFFLFCGWPFNVLNRCGNETVSRLTIYLRSEIDEYFSSQ